MRAAVHNVERFRREMFADSDYRSIEIRNRCDSYN